MGSVRVAIVGVGNCAASLVQGVEYYRDADPAGRVPGLMHVAARRLPRPRHRVRRRVRRRRQEGRPRPLRGHRRQREQHHQVRRRAAAGVTVQRGHTLDGLGKYYRETIDESDEQPVDVVQALKDAQADVLVCYLPVGSEEAAKFYAQCAIDAKVGFVNALPVFIAGTPGVGAEVHRRRRPDRRRRHQEPGRRHHHPPRDGEAVRGPRRRAGPHLPAQRRRQHGLQEHARARPPGVEEDLQDAGRHLQPRARPRQGATCTSARPTTCQWLDDRKWAYVRLEGRAFGDVPLNLEYKLEVWDSPNSRRRHHRRAALRQDRHGPRHRRPDPVRRRATS